jgi:Holliday junction resolvase RusA-like endonuclease
MPSVLRLSVTPTPAPRQTGRDAWNPSPRVVRYRAFRDELRIRAGQAGYAPGDQIDVVFYLPMPPSWSQKKRREMIGQPHRQKPDTDNLLKAFCDALLPEDDCHVWDMRGRKFWAAEGTIEVVEQTTSG